MIARVADTANGRERQERYIVPGLERGLLLIELFTLERPEMSLSELARELEINRSTAYRLAYTLEQMGFLERAPDGRAYRLGPRVLNLGFSYLRSLDLVEIARPHLERLRNETEAASHLAVLEGRDIVYLSRLSSNQRLTSNITVGSRLPAHATSMGRVMLMDLDDAALDALYAGIKLDRFTPTTATSLQALKAQLAEDRARGHVVSNASFEAGVASVAAPVHDDAGRVVAAISVVCSTTALDDPVRERVLIDATRAASRAISLWLGHRPPSVPAPTQLPQASGLATP